MRWIASFLLLAAGLTAQTDSRSWLNNGVQAFKNARYTEAVTAFEKAVELDPSSLPAHLYLGTAYMQQFIPAAESPENLEIWQKATNEFQRVISLESGNKVALASLASLLLNAKKWVEARNWYNQLLAVDPNNRDAYYSIGFIDWSQWYPAYGAARSRLGMRQEDPGPIRDAAVRASLRAQWWPTLEDGIWNLNRALELDPNYADAMAYMNLFIRERADLRDTQAEYVEDIRAADEWVGKALAAKKAQAERGMMRSAAPSPPPPPQVQPAVATWAQPRIVRQVAPVYPPLALQARIEGVVRFSATIDKEGQVSHLEVQSGHPLLVPPAIEAAKQWLYEPSLINGQPVEVKTQIEVYFKLPN